MTNEEYLQHLADLNDNFIRSLSEQIGYMHDAARSMNEAANCMQSAARANGEAAGTMAMAARQ